MFGLKKVRNSVFCRLGTTLQAMVAKKLKKSFRCRVFVLLTAWHFTRITQSVCNKHSQVVFVCFRVSANAASVDCAYVGCNRVSQIRTNFLPTSTFQTEENLSDNCQTAMGVVFYIHSLRTLGYVCRCKAWRVHTIMHLSRRKLYMRALLSRWKP